MSEIVSVDSETLLQLLMEYLRDHLRDNADGQAIFLPEPPGYAWPIETKRKEFSVGLGHKVGELGWSERTGHDGSSMEMHDSFGTWSLQDGLEAAATTKDT